MINSLHTIYMVKTLTSPTFKKDNFFKKVIHSMENTNIFLPHTDWDVEGGTVAQHKVLAIFVINKMVGTLMLLPFVYTGEF